MSPFSNCFKSQTIFFFILNTLFFLALGLSVLAQELPTKMYCFSPEECKASPYNGIPSSSPAPDCSDQPSPYNYYCYAPPPNVSLQVSLLGHQVKGLEEYLARVYQFLIALTGFFAGIMIVYAGVKWLLSAGNPEKINEAKKKISDALIGLILALLAYTILNTINPALLTLRLPPIKMTRQLGLFLGTKCLTEGIPDKKIVACGKKVSCQQYPQACGGQATGECFGQWCENSGEECVTVDINKFLRDGQGNQRINAEQIRKKLGKEAVKKLLDEKGDEINEIKSYTCINPNSCPGNTVCLPITVFLPSSAINSPATKEENLWKCLTSACPCAVNENSTKLKDGKPLIYCVIGKNPGSYCDADQECASGVCKKRTGQCTEIGGDPGGARCSRHIECASGICNTEADPDECVPVGGYQKDGATCEPDLKDLQKAGPFNKSVDEQCGPPGSGWKCVDVTDWYIPGGADGKCRKVK